jgi:hypothetical protein
MAREKGSRLCELIREDAHDHGLLDQTRKDPIKGHIEQCERNSEQSAKKQRQALENFGRRVRGED